MRFLLFILLLIGAAFTLAPNTSFAFMGDETGEFSHETNTGVPSTNNLMNCPWTDVDSKGGCPDASRGTEQQEPPTAEDRAKPSMGLYCETVTFFTGGWGKLAAIIVVTFGVYIFLTGKIVGGLIMIAAGTLITSVPSLFISFMAGFGSWANSPDDKGLKIAPGGFVNLDKAKDINFSNCKNYTPIDYAIKNDINEGMEDGGG